MGTYFAHSSIPEQIKYLRWENHLYDTGQEIPKIHENPFGVLNSKLFTVTY